MFKSNEITISKHYTTAKQGKGRSIPEWVDSLNKEQKQQQHDQPLWKLSPASLHFKPMLLDGGNWLPEENQRDPAGSQSVSGWRKQVRKQPECRLSVSEEKKQTWNTWCDAMNMGVCVFVCAHLYCDSVCISKRNAFFCSFEWCKWVFIKFSGIF